MRRLFNLIAGWEQRYIAEGVVLLPREGGDVGAVQIREKLRPIRRVRDLVDEHLAQSHPAIRASARVSPVEIGRASCRERV